MGCTVSSHPPTPGIPSASGTGHQDRPGQVSARVTWFAESKPQGSYLIRFHPGKAGEDFEEAKHSHLEDSENKVGGRYSIQPVVQN